MTQSSIIVTDELQQLCGYGLKICDGLELTQPTVGDIVKMGEKEYFSVVHTLTAIPTDMIAQLDDMGLDWEKVEDFDLFCMLCHTLTADQISIFFKGDVDFQRMEIIPATEEQAVHLLDPTTGLVIDEIRYRMITTYLCQLHSITKKPRTAGNSLTKRIMIEDAHDELRASARKPYKSSLVPMISAVTNMPGYKYNLQETMNIGFAQFMDSVQRLQIIETTHCLLQSSYIGLIDTKKINKKELNYMREI